VGDAFGKLRESLYPGCVVVVESGGEQYAGKFGEMTSWALKQGGAHGIVIDSYIRDWLGVLKFTKKPLRFFGMLGLPLLFVGALACVGLAIARLAYGMPLADRPALVLAVLMVVLGIQIIALGLIGELVIFASGRRIKEHSIERIVSGGGTDRLS
jgi:hypothetical protein